MTLFCWKRRASYLSTARMRGNMSEEVYLMMQIGSSRVRPISPEDLATECGFVADRLNNLLTAIQLKAGLLLESSTDAFTRERLRKIVALSGDAASYSTRLRNLSDAKIEPGNADSNTA
jgi:hypothetical protein